MEIDWSKLNKFDFIKTYEGYAYKSLSIGIFKWIEAKSFDGIKQSPAFFRIKFKNKDFKIMNNICKKVCDFLNQKKITVNDFPKIITYEKLKNMSLFIRSQIDESI